MLTIKLNFKFDSFLTIPMAKNKKVLFDACDFSPKWDQHIDVTITQSLTARPTTDVCLCGLYAMATTTAETTVMNKAVVSV